jgi:hypothetical protein
MPYAIIGTMAPLYEFPGIMHARICIPSFLMPYLSCALPFLSLYPAFLFVLLSIGIISLGLVITSIRTVVVERAHIRKKLVGLMLRKHQKRLNFLKRRARRYPSSLYLLPFPYFPASSALPSGLFTN